MKIASTVRLKETNLEFPLRVLYDEPNNALENHWHKETEIIYLLNGDLKVYINGNGYSLKQGDIIFLAPSDVHGAEFPINNVRIVIQFDKLVFEKSYLTNNEQDELYLKMSNLARVSTMWPENVKAHVKILVLSIYDSYTHFTSSNDSLSKINVQSKLFELIYYIILNVPMNTEQKSLSNLLKSKQVYDKLRIILDYINNHFTEDIKINDAASVLNFAPNYFIRFWKKNIGVSFHEYLNQVRINNAITLMINGNFQIKEIAELSGFNSVKTFNRVFKEITGTNPSTYKKVYL